MYAMQLLLGINNTIISWLTWFWFKSRLLQLHSILAALNLIRMTACPAFVWTARSWPQQHHLITFRFRFTAVKQLQQVSRQQDCCCNCTISWIIIHVRIHHKQVSGTKMSTLSSAQAATGTRLAYHRIFFNTSMGRNEVALMRCIQRKSFKFGYAVN